jgi:hypothetical protein
LRRVPVGQRVGVEDGTTHQPSVSLTHQSSRPGERRQQLAPFRPQDRIVNDAFSSIGVCDCVQHRCLEGSEQGTSLNSRHHPEQAIDGVASTIVRGRSIGQCLETPIHHMAREPIRSTTEVARVTLRHTSGANTWRYPAPGWDTSISRSVSGGWNATAICVIADATVMWTSAGTARSGWLKPRRRSRSPVRPVGTGKIWPASGGRSRGPAPAAILGL